MSPHYVILIMLALFPGIPSSVHALTVQFTSFSWLTLDRTSLYFAYKGIMNRDPAMPTRQGSNPCHNICLIVQQHHKLVHTHTCFCSTGAQAVKVLVEIRQVLDDVPAQAALLQHPVAVLVHTVKPLALGPEDAVVLHKVLAYVHFSAVLLKGAGPELPRALIVVGAHLHTDKAQRRHGTKRHKGLGKKRR